MKPDWDTLSAEFAESKTQLIGDVDCTAEGKPLCDANGVRGYPSLKWGDPNALTDYEGGRDLVSLRKFVEENLKPVCSPTTIELCDDDKKAEIEKFLAMPLEELTALINTEEKKLEEAEEEFKEAVNKLQETYKGLSEAKDATVAAVKESGLGLMKSCAAAAVAPAGGSDEL
jgi:hypothetical protein